MELLNHECLDGFKIAYISHSDFNLLPGFFISVTWKYELVPVSNKIGTFSSYDNVGNLHSPLF